MCSRACVHTHERAREKRRQEDGGREESGWIVAGPSSLFWQIALLLSSRPSLSVKGMVGWSQTLTPTSCNASEQLTYVSLHLKSRARPCTTLYSPLSTPTSEHARMHHPPHAPAPLLSFAPDIFYPPYLPTPFAWNSSSSSSPSPSPPLHRLGPHSPTGSTRWALTRFPPPLLAQGEAVGPNYSGEGAASDAAGSCSKWQCHAPSRSS